MLISMKSAGRKMGFRVVCAEVGMLGDGIGRPVKVMKEILPDLYLRRLQEMNERAKLKI
jgi:hypothetical protein